MNINTTIKSDGNGVTIDVDVHCRDEKLPEVRRIPGGHQSQPFIVLEQREWADRDNRSVTFYLSMEQAAALGKELLNKAGVKDE